MIDVAMVNSRRTSRAIRRACTGCGQLVPAASTADTDGLCASCADQDPLFDLNLRSRPRRHDGRWF